MLMRNELFTARAIVEVFADGALIASANDRENSTAIARASIVSNMRILWLNILHHANDLSKSFLGFFIEISHDELLHSFDETVGHSLSTLEMFLGSLFGGRVNHKIWLSLMDFLLFDLLIKQG